MAEKRLLTRIIMNHGEWASYANATAKDGEVIYVKVGTTQANGKVSEPIWMQKIGDGTTKVQNLPWVVAPAADVYEWAKKASLDPNDLPVIPGDKLGITLKVEGTGNAVTSGSWDEATKTITLTKGETFATKKDFDEHTHDDKADKVKNATAGNFAGLDENGNLTDSGKKATDFAEAGHNHDSAYSKLGHTHTHEDITDFDTEVRSIVSGMGIAGDEEVADLTGRVEAVETAVETTLPGLINDKVAQSDYNTKVQALEKADSDLDTAVKAAQAAAEAAQADIDAFFSAAETGDAAIDTLKEIQDFLDSDDGTVQTLLDDVADLKAADMTLQGNIDKKADQTTVDGIDDRLEAVEGKFDSEGKALNADKLDGKDSSEFATSDHNHDDQYVEIGAPISIGADDDESETVTNINKTGFVASHKDNSNYTEIRDTGINITTFGGCDNPSYFKIDLGVIDTAYGESTGVIVDGTEDFKEKFNEFLGTSRLDDIIDEDGNSHVDSATEADRLDGHDADYFATADHNHDDKYAPINIDTGVMSVTAEATGGLKVDNTDAKNPKIAIDDTIVFILDGGNASNLD